MKRKYLDIIKILSAVLFVAIVSIAVGLIIERSNNEELEVKIDSDKKEIVKAIKLSTKTLDQLSKGLDVLKNRQTEIVENQIELGEQISDTDSRLDELAEFTFPKAIDVKGEVKIIEVNIDENSNNRTNLDKIDGEISVIKMVGDGHQKNIFKKCGNKVKNFFGKIFKKNK